MSSTSKKYFNGNFKEKIWGQLIKKIKKAKSSHDMTNVLSKSLTPTELNLLEKRLAVLYLLKQGLSYRKISEIADVHYNTISFVKKGLKRPARKKKVWSEFGAAKNKKPKFLKYPAHKGKGRWGFLNTL